MIEKIGIVGGGQLGRMLTEAAQPLGFQVTVLDAAADCPASQVGAEQSEGSLQDPQAIIKLGRRSDVLTWEIEHINTEALKDLADAGYNVQPSPATLEVIQDKYEQKIMLERAGLPVSLSVASPSSDVRQSRQSDLMEGVIESLGGPVIIKTRTGGYDGRGNLRFNGDIASIGEYFGDDWSGLYIEKVVPFEKELSVIAARDMRGQIAVYPTVETIHEDNICHTVISPAEIDPQLADAAQEIAHETLKHLGGAGIFAIEMFATDKDVIINEIAPRVHNSGHHTIEANETSQFEQHIRAITGMPLGSTALRAPAAVMINILGSRTEPLSREGLEKVLALPDTHPHFYGKSSRPARKIGHITVLGSSAEQAMSTAQQARKELAV